MKIVSARKCSPAERKKRPGFLEDRAGNGITDRERVYHPTPCALPTTFSRRRSPRASEHSVESRARMERKPGRNKAASSKPPGGRALEPLSKPGFSMRLSFPD